MKTRAGLCLVMGILLVAATGCAWLNAPCNCGSAQQEPAPVPLNAQEEGTQPS